MSVVDADIGKRSAQFDNFPFVDDGTVERQRAQHRSDIRHLDWEHRKGCRAVVVPHLNMHDVPARAVVNILVLDIAER